ncbi:site-specific integrase [Blastococcus sp. CT_GayMR16]|uniref:tyrosine-type recombinase/integrase n=1 Tax=Blastococcus sp. CT_GayMR16 TaxID=2559607 RepID=UPI001074339C|nr:site-specific integrase [Blastococcus sp. CT_GayMR16]TFV89596.1 site-specific integrase [Blastococcus sp. CT_GayMR16]
MSTRIPTRTPGVYKIHRGKGTVYVARWREVDPTTGKARVRDKTFLSETAARQYRARVEHTQATGTYVDPQAGKVTFADVADQWLATASTSDIRPQTLEKYRRNLANYALPAFGRRRLDSITSRDVELWLRGLRTTHGQPLMPATVRRAYFPLQATFRYARQHNVIAINPCEGQTVKVPKALPTGREEVEGHFLSLTQVAALASKCAETDPVDGLLVRFAGGVGLRASEIAGLRVRDLRLARREVHVERTAKNVPGTGWVFEEPKSKKSRRRVPILDDELLHDLGLYLAGHPRRDELDAPFWPGRGRTGPDYGQTGADHLWNQQAFYRNVYRPAVAAVGLPADPHTGVRFHDLRHTCGSQWLADGHEMFSVSRWLGHSSVAFTADVYGHVAKEPDYTAAIERTRLARGL